MAEYLYEYFCKAVVGAMWEGKETRTTLLEFAGYIHKSSKSKLLIKLESKGKQSKDWFDAVVNKSIAAEMQSLPPSDRKAASIIQRRVRGLLGRNKARKKFVRVFVKR